VLISIIAQSVEKEHSENVGAIVEMKGLNRELVLSGTVRALFISYLNVR
jgi:hypothetical protein